MSYFEDCNHDVRKSTVQVQNFKDRAAGKTAGHSWPTGMLTLSSWPGLSSFTQVMNIVAQREKKINLLGLFYVPRFPYHLWVLDGNCHARMLAALVQDKQNCEPE